MNLQVDTEEIKRAVKIHDYVEKLEKLTTLSLKSSPIFLGLPDKQILLQIPVILRDSYEYVEQLYEDVSDHDCLFKAMRTGWRYIYSNNKIIPKTKEEYFQQLQKSHALHVAKQLGYLVPTIFGQGKQFCYGQYEAFHAAYDIFHSQGAYLSKLNSYGLADNSKNWQKQVKLISSQFIVPGTKSYHHKTPYIIDQLWITSNGKNRARLLGLEIAGEHHFLNEGKSKTLGKEEYLKELGYEMYYVASWWCRVDPYRVICEFLKASGIFPDAVKYLIGSELKTINEYKCGICHGPMVRWGWDWIQRYQVNGSTVLAHKSCVIHHPKSLQKC